MQTSEIERLRYCSDGDNDTKNYVLKYSPDQLEVQS